MSEECRDFKPYQSVKGTRSLTEMGATKFSGGESSVLANWVDFFNPTPGVLPWHGR